MNLLSEALLVKMATENLNQSQFASKLGIKPCLMSLIVNGKRTPSLDVVKAIYRKYPDMVEVLLK